MKRLASSLWLDFRLQFRNGFYYAAAFVTVVAIVILRQFPNLDFKWLLPALLLNNLLIGTFYFFGALVLLEKKEGTLEAQIVTPIRSWEYLLSIHFFSVDRLYGNIRISFHFFHVPSP